VRCDKNKSLLVLVVFELPKKKSSAAKVLVIRTAKLPAKEALAERFAQQVSKHGRGEIKCHLLEAKRQTESYTSQDILIGQEEVHRPDNQSQHDGVVLEMTRVDQDNTRLEENQEKSSMLARPGFVCEPALGENNDRGDVD
jgi:hypothetical protein